MPDLTAANVTITLQAGAPHNPRIEGTKRKAVVKIEFGDGALTYPTGGVPLPGAASFGLVRHLEDLVLLDGDDGSGILWKYDRENHKLRGYIQGVTVGAAGGGTADDFPLDTAADPLATGGSIALATGAGAGTKYLGRLKELLNTHAPAAQTLYAEAIGW